MQMGGSSDKEGKCCWKADGGLWKVLTGAQASTVPQCVPLEEREVRCSGGKGEKKGWGSYS